MLIFSLLSRKLFENLLNSLLKLLWPLHLWYHGPRGIGRGQWHQSNRGRNLSRGFHASSNAGILGSAPPPRAPFCNTCFLPGHVAAHCPHRPTPPAFAGLHFASPQPYASTGLQAPVPDPSWYSDTSATHHLTHNGA